MSKIEAKFHVFNLSVKFGEFASSAQLGILSTGRLLAVCIRECVSKKDRRKKGLPSADIRSAALEDCNADVLRYKQPKDSY